MFVNVAFISPKAGKEAEMIERMHRFAKSLEKSSGLLRVHVLSEIVGNALIGISMWEDEESFNRATEETALSPPPTNQESLTVVRQFVEV
jgi:heme-degrading monooxygenase HmoA